MSYFLVTAKCGHVGRNMFIPITFSVIAKSGKEAASRARKFPRVKHDHKDAILSVRKVDENEFNNQLEINNNDPYLHSTNKKEQNLIVDFESRLLSDNHNAKMYCDISTDKEYKIRKQKIIDDQYLSEIKAYTEFIAV